jgi:hypothetical protein
MIFMIDALGLCPLKLNVPPMVTFRQAANCGFVTIEQCRATVSGIGGFCEPNQFYTGPGKTPAKRNPKHHQD